MELPISKKFVDDAKAGGYDLDLTGREIEKVVLQPTAWIAFMKVNGCPGTCTGDVRLPACGVCGGWGGHKDPSKNMHKFIDCLLEGDDVEESLRKTLMRN